MSVSIGYRASMPLSWEQGRALPKKESKLSVPWIIVSHPPPSYTLSIFPHKHPPLWPSSSLSLSPPQKDVCVKNTLVAGFPFETERDRIVIKQSRAGTGRDVPVATTWTNLRLMAMENLKRDRPFRSLMANKRAYSNLDLMNVRCSEHHALFCILLLSFVVE